MGRDKSVCGRMPGWALASRHWSINKKELEVDEVCLAWWDKSQECKAAGQARDLSSMPESRVVPVILLYHRMLLAFLTGRPTIHRFLLSPQHNICLPNSEARIFLWKDVWPEKVGHYNMITVQNVTTGCFVQHPWFIPPFNDCNVRPVVYSAQTCFWRRSIWSFDYYKGIYSIEVRRHLVY